MSNVNTLVLCEDNYSSKEEWENEIKKAIMVLVNAGYIMTAELEEVGIFRIDYNYADESYGCDYPHWLSPDEWESVVFDDEKE